MLRTVTLPIVGRLPIYRAVELLFLIALGALAVYAVGLYQHPAVHEAFHDIRHAAGFPCH